MEIMRYRPLEHLRPYIFLNQVIPAILVDEWVILETPFRDLIFRYQAERSYEFEKTVLEIPISFSLLPLPRQNAIFYVIYRKRILIYILTNKAGFTPRTVGRIVRRDRVIIDRVLRLSITSRPLRRRGYYIINTPTRYYVLEFMLER